MEVWQQFMDWVTGVQAPAWLGVALLVAGIVLVALLGASLTRPRGRPFELKSLPEDRVQPYRERLTELERMFVTQPREALAGARQLVDEMLALMGYPARLGPADRARDLRTVNRNHSRWYRAAASVGDRSTTEEMRRALKYFLDIGRETLEGPRRPAPYGRLPEPSPLRRAAQPATAEPPVEQPAAKRPVQPPGDGEPVRDHEEART